MLNNSLSENAVRAIREIRNTLMHKGRTPTVRELMKALGYSSPRSASQVIERLVKIGVLAKSSTGKIRLIRDLNEDLSSANTIKVPIVGNVSCGALMDAIENIESFVPVSINIAHPPWRYFILKASGDSMNEAGINDGDLVLVRQQPIARNGELVVALVDNEATIKELRVLPDKILLIPKSTNKQHHPIILERKFQIQGVVVTSIPKT
jgi:repressor LexA